MGYYGNGADLLGRVEITGYEDLLGEDEDIEDAMALLGLDDDDLDLLGAARKRSRGRSRGRSSARARGAAARVATKGALVKSVTPTKSRRLYLPINSGVVVAGNAANVLIQPPQPVKIEELRLDPVQAVNFQITALNIGRLSQNMTAGAMAATVFSAANPGGSVNFDTAQTAEPITLAILNVGGVDATLTGMFVVLTVE